MVGGSGLKIGGIGYIWLGYIMGVGSLFFAPSCKVLEWCVFILISFLLPTYLVFGISG